jgi:hypothetical protein
MAILGLLAFNHNVVTGSGCRRQSHLEPTPGALGRACGQSYTQPGARPAGSRLGIWQLSAGVWRRGGGRLQTDCACLSHARCPCPSSSARPRRGTPAAPFHDFSVTAVGPFSFSQCSPSAQRMSPRPRLRRNKLIRFISSVSGCASLASPLLITSTSVTSHRGLESKQTLM